MKEATGLLANAPAYSEQAKKIFDVAIDHRRENLRLIGDVLTGQRYWDNLHVLRLTESTFSEGEFMACPGACIDSALVGAAKADYWYQNEKNWGDDDHVEDFDLEGDFDD